MVTSDDEMEEAPASTSGAQPLKKQPCKYGSGCWRSSKEHTDLFDHPAKPTNITTTTTSTTTTSSGAKQPCKWGAECYLTNPVHLQK
jgi:hypothetical protein